jgi:xanthine dehydrogenase accessory factor
VRAVLVRGANDVASAVAHRLFTAGYAVVLHEEAEPTAARRGMAFADAVFDGSAELEGVTAVRVDGPASAVRLLRDREAVPLAVGDLAALVAAVRPHVLVDAWMRKRAVPEDQRGLAPLVVGLGPNFVAGGNVDLAVETSWADLGRLVGSRGSAASGTSTRRGPVCSAPPGRWATRCGPATRWRPSATRQWKRRSTACSGG